MRNIASALRSVRKKWFNGSSRLSVRLPGSGWWVPQPAVESPSVVSGDLDPIQPSQQLTGSALWAPYYDLHALHSLILREALPEGATGSTGVRNTLA